MSGLLVEVGRRGIARGSSGCEGEGQGMVPTQRELYWKLGVGIQAVLCVPA
jgi:hypothetical protein